MGKDEEIDRGELNIKTCMDDVKRCRAMGKSAREREMALKFMNREIQTFARTTKTTIKLPCRLKLGTKVKRSEVEDT